MVLDPVNMMMNIAHLVNLPNYNSQLFPPAMIHNVISLRPKVLGLPHGDSEALTMPRLSELMCFFHNSFHVDTLNVITAFLFFFFQVFNMELLVLWPPLSRAYNVFVLLQLIKISQATNKT